MDSDNVDEIIEDVEHAVADMESDVEFDTGDEDKRI